MRNRKQIIKATISILCGIIVAFIIRFLPVTFSRYQTDTSSDASISYAFYILKADYYTKEVKLGEMVPSDNAYVYNFTVSNNDGDDRLETNLEYDLWIETTTNLPLDYEIYMDENYDDQGSTNIISSDEIYKDGNLDDDAYFRKIMIPKNYFSYTADEEHTYQLVVYFPKIYNGNEYQDIVEGVFINIDSKQVISS